MHRTDAVHAGLAHSPCTASDVDWQTAIAALSRAAERYGGLLASAGGNRAAAASQLWQRSCQDAELREDLAKAACALLTLASGGDEDSGSRRASGWLRRPGKLSKLDRDPEVAAFLNELLGKMYLNEARALAVQRFGPDRVPSRASFHRYLQRQRQARWPT